MLSAVKYFYNLSTKFNLSLLLWLLSEKKTRQNKKTGFLFRWSIINKIDPTSFQGASPLRGHLSLSQGCPLHVGSTATCVLKQNSLKNNRTKHKKSDKEHLTWIFCFTDNPSVGCVNKGVQMGSKGT